jgi:hypothetical protein
VARDDDRFKDAHFKNFAGCLDSAIQRWGEMPDDQEGFIARQKTQVERLDKLEEDFRRALIKHPWGPNVFREFVSFIRDKRRNILDARPYYRERQEKFTNEISSRSTSGTTSACTSTTSTSASCSSRFRRRSGRAARRWRRLVARSSARARS